MRPIFIFGKSREQNDLFEEEKEEHGDFIIGDFEDSYQNLPLKTLSGSGSGKSQSFLRIDVSMNKLYVGTPRTLHGIKF